MKCIFWVLMLLLLTVIITLAGCSGVHPVVREDFWSRQTPVHDSWAAPARSHHVTVYGPRGTSTYRVITR